MARAASVNLDAMIAREDFGKTDVDVPSFEMINSVSPRDLIEGGLLGARLRKPDFQRETNHWGPEQVASLLECFVDGDLIPSVILWQSPTSVFVIDGGHRLSALRAWVLDDYGDGPNSRAYFGNLSNDHGKAAQRTRELVNQRVGSWAQYQTGSSKALDPKRLNAVATRGLNIQWVKGNADKAEASFFKINTKGTDLDAVEESLLRNRRKPVAIAARAIVRAGKGHKYWSAFSDKIAKQIEDAAERLHSMLFDPELQNPVKTLELPLGGPKAVRAALEILIDLILLAIQNQAGLPADIDSTTEDPDGSETVKVLQSMERLVGRISGNKDGSLGLHPAVYFYGPSGRHSSPMFMGTARWIASKLRNNDKEFFKKFSEHRAKLEFILVAHKELIATILQKQLSGKRVERYADLMDGLLKGLMRGVTFDERAIVVLAGLEGKVVVGQDVVLTASVSDDTKSQVFIERALASAIKCPLCNGYVDTAKSVSYDHIVPRREGGTGAKANVALTHPYCNQAIKG